MFKNLPENAKLMLNTFLPTLGIILLAVIVVKFGLGKVSDTRSKMLVTQKNQSVLLDKLSIIRNFNESLAGRSGAILIALPDSNPSLAVLNQIKNLGFQSGVVISSIKSGVEVKEDTGISRVDITFDIDGSRVNILNFVKNVPTIAPITLVYQVKINETSASARANVTLRTFWAQLPSQLPILTEAVKGLDQNEMELISQIEGLTKPQFTQVPAAPSGKDDPFTL